MDVLIYGDTETSRALRHEVPASIGDPFLYLEHDGRAAVLTNVLEEARIADVAPRLERLLVDRFGLDELVAAGRSQLEIEQELCLRAAAACGIREAAVPPEFPLAIGDYLRQSGVVLTPDETLFSERRRRKTPLEIEGIRRAAGAAAQAMHEAGRILRGAEIRGGELWVDGARLTSETVRERIREVCARAGAPAPADIIVAAMGPDPPGGHESGHGPLPADTPILIDLWPCDEQSGCWADMTRTFVCGEVPGQIADIHRLVLAAHDRACAAVAPGIIAVELYGLACEVFEAAGYPTARTKSPGQPLEEGFYTALGHGVGLALHEAPTIGRSGAEQLIEGEAIALEPFLVDRAVGGVRVEDLLLVTGSGYELLTEDVPYGLRP